MLSCLLGRQGGGGAGGSRGAVPGRAVLCQPQRGSPGTARVFWGKDKVAGAPRGMYPRCLGVLWDVSLPLAALAGCWCGAGGRGGRGGPGGPASGRATRCRIHPRRRAGHITLRCHDNGNSYTLLFILKDTCSYLLLQSPQKIACHAKFLRGNRTGCFCP